MNGPLCLAAVGVVEINEAKNPRMPVWQTWCIGLVGKNVSDVAFLNIGFDRLDSAGGAGKVLIEDLRLYPLDREQIP